MARHASVHVWLPGRADPVAAGDFAWDSPKGPGRFQYAATYLDRRDAFALDPIHLSLGSRSLDTARQTGVFGVFRDSGPDSWGETQIKRKLRHADLDPFDRLVLGSSNGAGCLVLGDIDPSRSEAIWTPEDLHRAYDSWITQQPPEQPQPMEEFISAVAPATSQGGAKPKLELVAEQRMWMLKFPAQGDPDDLAGIEAAALSLARACGIETPEHRTVQIGAGTPKSGLMIERFDRRRIDGGFARHAYASAHTVMDLDTGSEGPERRSYLNFAHEALRWCASGTDRRHGEAQRREIWRRIVFNALVNNNDDHPRNHALIKDGPLWRLSPIFDVVPVGQHQAQRVLSMAFRREREFANVASRENLLACSRLYGWRQQEAEQELQRMALIVSRDWEAMMLRHGTTRRSIGQRASAFGLAMEIAAAA